MIVTEIFEERSDNRVVSNYADSLSLRTKTMTALNRRRYRRIATSALTGSPCIVESEGHQAHCVLIDESIGGYRIKGIDPLFLPKNQPLRIAHRDEVVSVLCANVSRVDGAKLSIGLQRFDTMPSPVSEGDWDDMARFAVQWQGRASGKSKRQLPEPAGSLLQPFFRYRHRIGITCRILQVKEDDRLVIEILRQRQFEVGANVISSLTREERREELQAEPSIDWLANVYSEGSYASGKCDVESVLEFEFGAE